MNISSHKSYLEWIYISKEKYYVLKQNKRIQLIDEWFELFKIFIISTPCTQISILFRIYCLCTSPQEDILFTRNKQLLFKWSIVEMDIAHPTHTFTGGCIFNVDGMSNGDFIVFIIGNKNGSWITEEKIKDWNGLITILYGLLKIFRNDRLSSKLGIDISIISEEDTWWFKCTCITKTFKNIITKNIFRKWETKLSLTLWHRHFWSFFRLQEHKSTWY